MKHNPVKAALQAGRPQVGTWLSLGNVFAARLMARGGRPGPTRAARRQRAGGVLMVVSGRNRLRGIVEEVRREGLVAQVRLRIGEQWLTAVITRDAVDELGLKRGDEATALVKATEVMIAREAPTMGQA